MKAAPLKKGDKIGVMAPSSYVEENKVMAAKSYLEGLGFEIYLHPQHAMRFHQSAGSHKDKLDALHELFADQSVKAIIAAGGGNRALHLLDNLDYELIRKNPKILMGFSDVTALLNAIYARTGLTTFHGPVFTWIPRMENHFSFTLDVLSGSTPAYPMTKSRILREGQTEGILTGGNLSIFQYMAGSRFAPAPEGTILFLEDVGEEPSKIDRMLLHLRHSGYFENISGLICGGFTEQNETGRPFGFALDDLIREHTEGYDFPVIMDAPFGHGNELYTLPIGGKASLHAEKSKISLELIESSTQTD